MRRVRQHSILMSYSIKLSDFLNGRDDDHRQARAEWEAMKASADYVIRALSDEILYGDEIETCEALLNLEDAEAAKKEPYGNVTYADPGYQADKKKRYPIDTEEHIRAAWSYINQEKNHKGYTSGQVSKIKSRIVSAWKKKIDPKGPPSA